MKKTKQASRNSDRRRAEKRARMARRKALKTKASKGTSKRIDVQEVMSVSVGDVDGCTCPICAEIAHSGDDQIVVGEDGEMRTIQRDKPPMMSVTVKVQGALCSYVHQESMDVPIPVGCCVQDLLEFVRYKNQGLMQNFAPASLQATIDGKRVLYETILKDGQVLEVDGTPDSQWSGLISPWPSAPFAQA